MKRLGVILALVLPAVILGLWAAFPQADQSLAAPLFHFYIVTFTTFAATVVSLFVAISVGETALPRHLLLAVAFAWMGAVFLIHGSTTPGAIITHFHPAIVWSSWLTLFGGGIIFLIGALAPNQPSPSLLRAVTLAMLAVYAVYVAVVVLQPGLLNSLLNLGITPTLQDIVFVITLLIWLAASARHFVIYRQTRNFIDGLMAFEAGWFATATVSMFRFPLWNSSWWLYHALLLAGFLIAIYALWRAYEQVRAFRLTRYYGATSLIVTAALALLAAQVYADLVFRSLHRQLAQDTVNLSQYFATALGEALPDADTVEELRLPEPPAALVDEMQYRFSGAVAFDAIYLYDGMGFLVLSDQSRAANPVLSPDDLPHFQAALAGLPATELYVPGEADDAYTPSADVHHLHAYVPVWPGGSAQASAPVAVLMTVREAPELTQALTASRGSGLVLAALSLGGLFMALLVIVNRADALITSRTRDLERAYADLRQAEGMRDDLTRMIIHDLRNPLTAITANLDLISKTLNNPAYSGAPPRFLNGARGAGQRMMGMIDDLLNVSKFEAGELRPVLAPVYLPTLLNEKAEFYRSQAEKENKRLSVHAPAELPLVMADAGLIGRVVDNLVSNAFKYTDENGCIELMAERNGAHIYVRVRDDGQGIPPEFHSRIFDKFVQVTDANGTPLRKGTGLGLTFCRLAVEAHGGHIRVASSPQRGSEFVFTLPLNSN